MIVLNTAWNLVNFRAGLIRTLVEQGYEVIAVAPCDQYAERLLTLGCRYIPLKMDNKGTHPGRDLLLLWRFWCLLRREQPDVFLGYTVKPNIYGSIAAHLLGIPVVNNIAGLGAAFMKSNWLTRLVRTMYRVSLSRSAHVFFQNNDDRALFVESGLVDGSMTDRLPGSGIDLHYFSSLASRASSIKKIKKKDTIQFLLVARMLWDKGVGEYVDAARMLKQRYPNVVFSLLGFLDVENPSAIRRTEMDAWLDEGIVDYLGATDDIRPYLMEADAVVLPSYREGLPRTLLEAAAMSRPIITTDVPGCRDVIEDGLNGFLCREKDSIDLADKLEKMISLTPSMRDEMGRQGRLKVERGFDEQIVIRKYLQVIDRIVSEKEKFFRNARGTTSRSLTAGSSDLSLPIDLAVKSPEVGCSFLEGATETPEEMKEMSTFNISHDQ